MSSEGVQKSHVSIVPHLDGLVPRGSDAKGWLFSVVESHSRDSISVHVLFDSMLALRTGVPDLDFVILSSSNDLSVIWGKINRENISFVTNELGDGSSVVHVPESDGTVPGGGESKAGVAGKLDLRDEVRMSSQHLFSLSHWGIFFKFSIISEFPFDESLVTRSREEELLHLSVDFFLTNSERGDPATVTFEISLIDELVLL